MIIEVHAEASGVLSDVYASVGEVVSVGSELYKLSDSALTGNGISKDQLRRALITLANVSIYIYIFTSFVYFSKDDQFLEVFQRALIKNAIEK